MLIDWGGCTSPGVGGGSFSSSFAMSHATDEQAVAAEEQEVRGIETDHQDMGDVARAVPGARELETEQRAAAGEVPGVREHETEQRVVGGVKNNDGRPIVNRWLRLYQERGGDIELDDLRSARIGTEFPILYCTNNKDINDDANFDPVILKKTGERNFDLNNAEGGFTIDQLELGGDDGIENGWSTYYKSPLPVLGKQKKRRRGRHPHHKESTGQHLNHAKNAGAPATEYYRKFAKSKRGTKESDPGNHHAHAGLKNCSQICYSNAIFHGLASCHHMSEFIHSPPSDHDKRFPLYHAFASIMNSIVGGRETVVDNSAFIKLFRQRLSGVPGDVQEDEQDEQEPIHQDAHEYILKLEEYLLEELKGGSSGIDEELYTKMTRLWQLFSGGKTTDTITCPTCKNASSKVDDFGPLLLYFPDSHHHSDGNCTLDELFAHHCATSNVEDYLCTTCNERLTVTKDTAFTNLPTILCVVLERKKFPEGKIGSSVNFPVSGLSITNNDLQYDLVGTVHYKENGEDHGHYTSICRSQRSNVWYSYDDERVSTIQFVMKQKPERVLKNFTRSATVLFYELQTRDGGENCIEIDTDSSGSGSGSRFSS